MVKVTVPIVGLSFDAGFYDQKELTLVLSVLMVTSVRRT